MEKTTRRRAAGVSQRVYETLQKRIVRGEYAEGSRIPTEKQLCEEFGISRVTVRAAINRLIGLGLLKSVQGDGTYVCSRQMRTLTASSCEMDAASRINMFEFRRILEMESVVLAAMRADMEMIGQMRAAIRAMKKAKDPHEVAKQDMRFHEAIIMATRNEYIIAVFELIRDAYLQFLEQNVSLMGAYGAQSHEMICRAIEMRDGELARQHMAVHLSETIQYSEVEKNDQ